MPRFVLLYHDCPPTYPRPSHWDLMLESGDMLRTWALTKLPQAWHHAHEATMRMSPGCPEIGPSETVHAEALGDHRLAYLEFEGKLSENRGQVWRIADGTFQEEWQTPFGWCVTLRSTTLNGRIELVDTKEDSQRWTLTVAK